MHEQQPAFDVPPPDKGQPEPEAGQHGEAFKGETEHAKALEQGTSVPPPPPPSNQQSAAPATPPPVSQPADDQQQATLPQGWMPQIADDTDLIEKEWVDKAKEIVAHTTGDPYLQNKEINRVRADYLKKRYNKELKQSD